MGQETKTEVESISQVTTSEKSSEKFSEKPLKKPRTEKQLEWSRQLGKRSQEFKRAKKDREMNFTSHARKEPEPDPEPESNEKYSSELQRSEPEIHSESQSSGPYAFLAVIAIGIVAVIYYYPKMIKKVKPQGLPVKHNVSTCAAPAVNDVSVNGAPVNGKTKGTVNLSLME